MLEQGASGKFVVDAFEGGFVVTTAIVKVNDRGQQVGFGKKFVCESATAVREAFDKYMVEASPLNPDLQLVVPPELRQKKN